MHFHQDRGFLYICVNQNDTLPKPTLFPLA